MNEQVTYEKREWSNNWWNNADDSSLPRVLLIGDSISCSYGPEVIKILDGQMNVDRVANSRSINDPMLFGEVGLALDNYQYPIVHFNNGLHGWHITEDDYGVYLRRYVAFLKEKAPTATLIWATSTPITEEGNPGVINETMNARVEKRNEVSLAVMRDNDITVNDLYSLVYGKAQIRVDDGYHYNADGAQLMGKAVAAAITSI